MENVTLLSNGNHSWLNVIVQTQWKNIDIRKEGKKKKMRKELKKDIGGGNLSCG